MFYHLTGKVSEYTPSSLVLDVGGIGFDIKITPMTASALGKGDTVKVYISESVGEDHFDLYGFLSDKEKRLFEQLITISGVGPKAALSILSSNTPEMLTSAIINNNEAALTNCPGIGKKTAQRVILELKDKIAKGMETSLEDFQLPVSCAGSSAFEEAVSALVVLGYNRAEVIPIIKKIDSDNLTSEQIIREVLRYMI